MRFVIILLFILFSFPAFAAIQDDINWIINNSDLEYNNEPLPKIKYVHRKDLKYVGLSTVGTFDPKTTTIYLANDLEGKNKKAKLIHELVHYLQFLEGKDHRNTCAGLLEPEAYEIEEKWSKENEHEFKYDKYRISAGVSACMQESYK